MGLKFNIDRPKVSDEEIKKHQDFGKLVRQFKEQSIKKARGDESWWRNKKVHYTAVIAGVTVICTVTYLSLFNNQQQSKQTAKNDKITTSPTKITTRPATGAFVSPPSRKLKTAYSAYKVNNAKGATIVHPTETRIKVPKNSFVDRHGKDVIGEVTLEYREFHDLGDIVVNGIPMRYDSAGIPFNLESAGMFDIRGQQNGQPVFIKEGKPLKVELASRNAEDRFNQYYLDTVQRNWVYLRRDNLAASSASAQRHSADETRAAQEKIKQLEMISEKIIPAKIDSVKNVYTRLVTDLPAVTRPAQPVKATPGRPTFQIEGSTDDFPELAAFNNVIFEVGPENRNYHKDMHDITWNDVKISQGPVKGKNYLLQLIYRDRNEKLVVYPVLTGTDYEAAEDLYATRLARYEELVAKKATAEKRLLSEMEKKQQVYLADQKRIREQASNERVRLEEELKARASMELTSGFRTMSDQAKTSRLFEVNRFGIFNSDCPHSRPAGEPLRPKFFVEKSGQFLTADIVYLVDHTKKMVYQFAAHEQQNIRVTGGNEYSFCLFRNRQLYLCDKKNFSSSVKNGAVKFAVRELDEDAGIAEFKKALEI